MGNKQVFRRSRKKAEENAVQQSFNPPEDVQRVGRETGRDPHDWKLVKVVYDGTDKGYSVAIGESMNHPGRRVCAIRWNGNYEHTGAGPLDDVGTPAQKGQESHPVWFVLPEFLWEPIIEACYNGYRDEAIKKLNGD